MYIGIDVGGTTIKYGLLTTTGEVIEKQAIPTPKERNAFIDTLVDLVNQLAAKEDIQGIGISMPGIVRKDGYLLTAGSIKELDDCPLRDILLEKTDNKYPIVIENDANSVAYAEKWIGNAQGMDNYVCLVLGTGVGGGIVINGDIYRGAHGMAGEFGWMLIDKLPPQGNIESASANYRAAVVLGLCQQYNQLKLAENPNFEPINDARIIFDTEDSDPFAAFALKNFYRDVAITLLNLYVSFDPELILIGGAISTNPYFMERLRETVEHYSKRHNSIAYLIGKTIAPIKATYLQNDAGMIGAVYRLHQQINS